MSKNNGKSKFGPNFDNDTVDKNDLIESNDKKDQTDSDSRMRKSQYKAQKRKGRNPKFSADKQRKAKSALNADNTEGKWINDPSWYSISEQTGKDVASLPFNVLPGTYIDLFSDPKTNNVDLGSKFGTFPGAMILRYAAVPGTSRDNASAINIASRAIYTWVRHQNSGHANYESVDLMIYILAMQNVYNLILEGKRLYRLAMSYSNINRNVPVTILKAMGYNVGEISSNMAQLRYELNVRIAKVNSMCVPKAYDAFKRQALLAGLVISDGNSMRSQFYVPMLDGYYKFNATSAGGGSLTYKRRKSPTVEIMGWKKIIEEIDDALNVILADEDCNIMSGDILKAYGAENCYSITPLKDDEVQSFIYDELILAQIQNATCWEDETAGLQLVDSQLDITQEVGNLRFAPKLTVTGTVGDPNAHQITGIASKLMSGMMLNFKTESPDWKYVLEGTRFTSVALVDISRSSNEISAALDFICGTEFIRRIYMVWFDESFYSNDATPLSTSNYVSISTVEYFDSVRSALRELVGLSAFDNHPTIYVCAESSGVSVQPIGAIAEIETFTIVTVDTLDRIHDEAVMGEFKTHLVK